MTPVKDSVPVQQHVPVQQSVPVVSSQSSAFNDAISQRINRDIASRDQPGLATRTAFIVTRTDPIGARIRTVNAHTLNVGYTLTGVSTTVSTIAAAIFGGPSAALLGIPIFVMTGLGLLFTHDFATTISFGPLTTSEIITTTGPVDATDLVSLADQERQARLQINKAVETASLNSKP
jgi:hypothetical protein